MSFLRSKFARVRLATLASTTVITYFFTGEIILASALSLTLIGVNSAIMYYVLREK